jgi:hypothetical protein
VIGGAAEKFKLKTSKSKIYSMFGVPQPLSSDDELPPPGAAGPQPGGGGPGGPQPSEPENDAGGARSEPGLPGDTPAKEAKPPKPKPQVDPVGFSTAVKPAIQWVSTHQIHTDPDRFQFKRGADDDSGITKGLPAAKFDEDRAVPLALWHDPADHRNYVVDGHHRFAWGKRDGAKSFPVKFVQAKDAGEAMAAGKRIDAVVPKMFSEASAPKALRPAWTDDEMRAAVAAVLAEDAAA